MAQWVKVPTAQAQGTWVQILSTDIKSKAWSHDSRDVGGGDEKGLWGVLAAGLDTLSQGNNVESVRAWHLASSSGFKT